MAGQFIVSRASNGLWSGGDEYDEVAKVVPRKTLGR